MALPVYSTYLKINSNKTVILTQNEKFNAINPFNGDHSKWAGDNNTSRR